MPLILVTADLGNSRLKLAAWDARQSSVGAGVERATAWIAPASIPEEGELEGIRAWFDSLSRTVPDARFQCVLASVAGTTRRDRIFRALEHASGAPPTLPDHGLTIRCHTPESVGQDRLFAARGALAYQKRSCIVIDAGTALTVDAVLAEGSGVFLGGAIAPGPALLAGSLATGAARLPNVALTTDGHAVGGDTAEAIRSGVVLGLRGAARELVETITKEASLSGCPLMLTGGARVFLLEPSSPFSQPVTVVEDLVPRGLLAGFSASEEARGAGST